MIPSFLRIPLCFLILFLFSYAVHSTSDLQALSQIDGLKIRLVPTHPEPISGLGIKTVEVRQEGPDILVKWFSPARLQTANTPRQAGSAPWPEYKVNLIRGGVHTNGLNEAVTLAHPHLWIEGVVQLDQNGLLWVSPQIVDSGAEKKSFSLEPGFLAPSFLLFKKGPPDLVAKIEEFRMAAETTPNADVKKFFDDFATVHVTDVAGKYPLVVNGRKTDVPVVMVGNKYVEYTVLALAQNPLVLQMTFYPENSPKFIRQSVDFFHRYLEFKITQVFTNE